MQPVMHRVAARLQRTAQVGSEQSAPFHPSMHVHSPPRQPLVAAAWPEQWCGHGRLGTLQRAPLQPDEVRVRVRVRVNPNPTLTLTLSLSLTLSITLTLT